MVHQSKIQRKKTPQTKAPAKKDEEEDDTSDEEEETPKTKAPAKTQTKAQPAKTQTKAPAKVPAKKEEDDTSDEEEETPKTKTPAKTQTKVPAKAPAKKEEDDTSDEEEETPKTKTPAKTQTKAPVKAPAKKDEEEDDTSDEEEETPKTKTPAKTQTKVPVKAPAKKEEEDEDSDSEELHVVKPEDTPSLKGIKRKREDDTNDFNSKKRKIDTKGGDGGTKVRLGNLSFDLDGKDDEIKQQFSDCGEIKGVELIQKRDGKFAGVAIIEFETAEGATNALAKNEEEFYGRKMLLSYPKEEKTGGGGGFGSKGPSEKPEGCTTVFIGNLSYQINEDEVWEFFSKCGNIKQVRWNQGDFKGYGWVEFDDTNAPDEAMKLNGENLAGRPIRIDFAAPRKQRENQW